jgi:hypothetical protein
MQEHIKEVKLTKPREYEAIGQNAGNIRGCCSWYMEIE